MAKFLNFFPRQTFIGNPSTSGTYYSDVFDAADAAEVYWELKLHSTSATGDTCTALLEHTDDPSMSGFGDYGAAIVVSGSTIPTLIRGSSSTIPKRYMRTKLSVSTGGLMTVSFVGRCFR